MLYKTRPELRPPKLDFTNNVCREAFRTYRKARRARFIREITPIILLATLIAYPCIALVGWIA